MGHYLGFVGLLLLLLALLARSISRWWNQPLNHLLIINVFVFVTTIAHVIYVMRGLLNENFGSYFLISTSHQLGILTGIVSLFLLVTTAIKGFQSTKYQFTQNWRKTYWLNITALALAFLHASLVG